MKKEHYVSIFAFLLLFSVLYFGCETKSKDTIAVEKSRALNFETINIQKLKTEAVERLDETTKQEFLFLNQMYNEASNDSLKTEALKKIAGFWYKNEEIILSGQYAKNIAEEVKTEDTWSITGTTFSIAFKKAKNENEKDFAHKNAIEAFETAISINPENTQHRINLALCYVERPSKDNPMQGIMQLLDLNKANPDNVAVILQLAKLGMQTSQWEKVIGRLNKVLTLEPNNIDAVCMLASAYAGKGDVVNEEKYKNLCRKN